MFYPTRLVSEIFFASTIPMYEYEKNIGTPGNAGTQT